MKKNPYKEQKINGILYFIYDFPIDEKKAKKRVYGRSKEELEEKIEKEREKRDKRFPDRPTFLTALDYWIIYIYDGTYMDKCRYRAMISVRMAHLEGYEFRDISLKELSKEWLNAYLSKLYEAYDYESVAETWGFIKEALGYAVKRGILDKEILNLNLPTSTLLKSKKELILSEYQMRVFYKECLRLNAYGGYYYGVSAIAFIFILNTGLRAKEICDLKWSDIEDDYIKLNEERIIPIPVHIRPLLKELYGNNEYVFNTKSNVPLIKSSLDRALPNILHNSCLPEGITPLSLRYTYCDVLLRRGIDKETVSRLIGQDDIYLSSVQMTVSEILEDIFERDKDELFGG